MLPLKELNKIITGSDVKTKEEGYMKAVREEIHFAGMCDPYLDKSIVMFDDASKDIEAMNRVLKEPVVNNICNFASKSLTTVAINVKEQEVEKVRTMMKDQGGHLVKNHSNIQIVR